MENQIKELKLEDEQLYKAYLADVFDGNEYAERRGFIKDQQQKLQAEMSRLETGLMSVDQFEERKQEILKICQNAANSGLVFDAPFEVRQRIIKTIVDKITLNANEGWFELEGVISGQYLFENNNEDGSDEGPNDQNDPGGEVGQIVCNPRAGFALMAWANRHPVLMWTIAWGVTGISLYVSGVFNSPRTGPLWVAIAGGMISWSIAGVSTFSKHWTVANFVIWAFAYILSFALAGFLLNLSLTRYTIIGLFLALTGWSGGAAFGAFASTWLASDHPRLMQSGAIAIIWMLGFFIGSFIAFAFGSYGAELVKIFIGFLIGVPAALILGFGSVFAFGGSVASAIAISAARSVTRFL